MTQNTEFTLNLPRLLTVKQAVQEKVYPNEGGLRAIIFNAEKNGFNKVIRRINRKVFIDVAKFYEWVEETNGGHVK